MVASWHVLAVRGRCGRATDGSRSPIRRCGWVPGNPASIKKVAALGYNMLLGQFDSLEKVSQGIALFKAEVEANGRTFDPMSVAVARSLYVVRSAAEYEQAIETRMAGRRRTQRLAQRPNLPIRAKLPRLGRSTARRTRSAPSSRRCVTSARNTCCSTVQAASPLCVALRRKYCRRLLAAAVRTAV